MQEGDSKVGDGLNSSHQSSDDKNEVVLASGDVPYIDAEKYQPSRFSSNITLVSCRWVPEPDCYGLLQFFGHMGPGSTIGLISTECFPTAMRSFGYSIAAAWGKTGATIGTEVFTPLQDGAGDASTFYLLAGVAVLGMAVYYFLPEGRDLDLEREDPELRAWLEEKAYEVER